ncbi:7537_t:CDS:2, partial [Acaulospora morrowiae]
ASEKILEPPKIQVEPLRSKNVSSFVLLQNYFQKSDNKDINNFLVRSSYNQAKRILEWIPYKDFLDIEYIRIGGFNKIYKAAWHRGYIKHRNLLTEVVRSESVKVH